MMILSRSLSNYSNESDIMQVQIQNIIEYYLEKKFHISHSFTTKSVYRADLKKFIKFARVRYNFSFEQLLNQILQKTSDPLEILDEYHTFLSNYQTKKKRGYVLRPSTNTSE